MEFHVRNRAVYFPSSDALICADLHIGRGDASGVEAPLGEHEDLTERFGSLMTHYEPTEVVIAGDLLHSFDRIPASSTRTIRALETLAADVGARTVVTPGNHDTMLSEIWDGPIVPEYRLDGGSIVVTHGHVPPETDAEWYVVGHDHPTIEIEGVRRPCYLYAPEQYGDSGVLMLPTFSRLPAGVAINEMAAGEFLSPLITDADSIRPIVHDAATDETHEFPALRELRRFL